MFLLFRTTSTLIPNLASIWRAFSLFWIKMSTNTWIRDNKQFIGFLHKGISFCYLFCCNWRHSCRKWVPIDMYSVLTTFKEEQFSTSLRCKIKVEIPFDFTKSVQRIYGLKTVLSSFTLYTNLLPITWLVDTSMSFLSRFEGGYGVYNLH